jgi:hypothetical protein
MATPSLTYRVARAGQPSRELSLDEINRALASGDLAAEDTYWREGMAKWEPLRALPGLIFPREIPNRSAAGMTRAAAAPADERAREAATSVWGAATPYAYPAIWPVGTLVALSFVFTPVLGATLIALNYRSIGRPDQGKAAVVWRGISVVALLLLWAAIPFWGANATGWAVVASVYFILWLAWALACAWPHQRFLFTEIGPRRRAAPWTWPVLGGLTGLVLWLGGLVFLAFRA